VRRIFAEAAGGATMRAIAARLTADRIGKPTARGQRWWSFTSVRWILTHPTYAGRVAAYRYQKTKNAGGTITMRLRPEAEVVALPDGTAPPLVDGATFDAVQERLRLNKEQASRNNREPEASLLRGGYARCGYCATAMQVVRAYRRGQHPQYRCGRGPMSVGACWGHRISVPLIDAVVWERIEGVLTRPEIIEAELQRMEGTDPATDDLATIDRALADIARKQANLVEQLADLGGPVAALVTERLGALQAQREQLAAERERVLARSRTWRAARERLGTLQTWCRSVATRLADLSYEQKRLALDALGARVKVWKTEHEPRYEVALSIPLSDAGSIVFGSRRGSARTSCPAPPPRGWPVRTPRGRRARPSAG
jgi:site-specific DNA recombinase